MAKRKPSTFERLRKGKLPCNRKQRRELERRLNSTDPGLEIINPHAAGIDVGNESHYVAVPPGRDARPVREFGSWTAALEEMAQWLKSCGVETVVMQSTGVYWIAVHDVLERHGLEVNLVDARATKSVPGRKTPPTRALPIATSSLSGKTPTPTFRYSGRPKMSMRSCDSLGSILRFGAEASISPALPEGHRKEVLLQALSIFSRCAKYILTDISPYG